MFGTIIETLGSLVLADGAQSHSLTLQHTWPVEYILAAIALALVAAGAYAWAERTRRGRRGVITLFVLRSTLLALTVWSLAEPRLVGTTIQSIPSNTAVLVDSSASMRLHDAPGMPRHAHVGSLIAKLETRLVDRPGNSRVPADRAQLEIYATGTPAARVTDVSELSYTQAQTQLGDVLTKLRDRVAVASLGSIVLVSDGDFPLSTQHGAQIRQLRAAGARVHVLGVGDTRVSDNLEITALSAPTQLPLGALASVAARVQRLGAGGRNATVRLQIDGLLFGQEVVAFDTQGRGAVSFQVPLKQPGL
jgi:hypothetical protein